MNTDEHFMRLALAEAHLAYQASEVPIGAAITHQNTLLATAHNSVETLQDASAHAETLCLRLASEKLHSWRLTDLTLYTTLEPCAMCLGFILLARLKRLVWGAPDLRHGACGSWINLLTFPHPTHSLQISCGVLALPSAQLMRNFFHQRRLAQQRHTCHHLLTE